MKVKYTGSRPPKTEAPAGIYPNARIEKVMTEDKQGIPLRTKKGLEKWDFKVDVGDEYYNVTVSVPIEMVTDENGEETLSESSMLWFSDIIGSIGSSKVKLGDEIDIAPRSFVGKTVNFEVSKSKSKDSDKVFTNGNFLPFGWVPKTPHAPVKTSDPLSADDDLNF